MAPELFAGLFGLVGVFVGGLISTFLHRQRYQQEIELLKTQFKTEFRAEDAARRYLSDPKFIERSFNHLRERLGGFDDSENELRRILIRAGAVRAIREKDQTEWWHLLERTEELIARRKARRKRTATPPR